MKKQNVVELIKDHSVQDDNRFEAITGKLDSFHVSLKEDLTEIKLQTQRTNGRVTTLEASWNTFKGALMVLSAIVVPLFLYIIYTLINAK